MRRSRVTSLAHGRLLGEYAPWQRQAMFRRSLSSARATWTLQRLIALSLIILLGSCSTPSHVGTAPSVPQDLSHYALVIEETADGQVIHSWVPASTFDLSRYAYRPSAGSAERRIVHASFSRDCEEERDQCEETCKASLKGRNWSHANAGSKAEICRSRCRPAYLDCSRLREQAEAVTFPVGDKAVDWLKRHREEILLGTVVVIAGVAFTVVIVGSAGTALVLVPAVLLVSSETPPMPYSGEEEP